jgi:hypothetical protein
MSASPGPEIRRGRTPGELGVDVASWAFRVLFSNWVDAIPESKQRDQDQGEDSRRASGL